SRPARWPWRSPGRRSSSSAAPGTCASTPSSGGTGMRRYTPSSRGPARFSGSWCPALSRVRTFAEPGGPMDAPFILSTMARRGLLHDDEFFDLVGSVPPAVRRISADGDARRPSLAALIAGAPADDLAPPERPGRTIVLTSGTTGTPKGAQRPVPPGFGPLASLL